MPSPRSRPLGSWHRRQSPDYEGCGAAVTEAVTPTERVMIATRRLAAALVFTALGAGPVPAQQLEPVRYLLRIPAPATHYLEVQATYPTSKQAEVELMMPVWTPGPYLVREFARHVEGVQARDSSGRPLQVEKSRKNRWRVRTAGARAVVLTYRVYAHEVAARTN